MFSNERLEPTIIEMGKTENNITGILFFIFSMFDI